WGPRVWSPPSSCATASDAGRTPFVACAQRWACPREGWSLNELEQHLHGAGGPLVVGGSEGLLVGVERVAVRDDRRHVDPMRAEQIEVVAHGVLPLPVPLLDAEGVRADEIDLLEVVGRPFEARGRVDAGED